MAGTGVLAVRTVVQDIVADVGDLVLASAAVQLGVVV